ncbi:MAG: hypothetical protein ACE5NP_07520 [Anaerolineae bacterium]
MKRLLLLCLALLVVSGCGPSKATAPGPAATKTALAAKVMTAVARQVATATPTPHSGRRPTPTSAPLSTITPSRTRTPTSTPTPTLSTTAIPGCQDDFEPDDTAAQAKQIWVSRPQDIKSQTRNFFPPGDVDVARFASTAGRIYQIVAEPWGYGFYGHRPHITVLDPRGFTFDGELKYYGDVAAFWFWYPGPGEPLDIKVTESNNKGDCTYGYTLRIIEWEPKELGK